MIRLTPNEKLYLKRHFLCFLAVIGMLLSGASSSHAQVGIPWTWGRNGEGQLGDGTRTDGRSTPGQVKGLTGVVKAVGGGWQFLALKSDGTVWDWGVL